MKVTNLDGESHTFELVVDSSNFFDKILKLSSNALGLVFTFEQYELDLFLNLLRLDTIEEFIQLLRDSVHDDGSMIIYTSKIDDCDVLTTCVNEE